eukprot:PITA_18285
MDDFTPYGDAFETALVNLEKVLESCEQTNVALSTQKCHMMMNEEIVLGHFISADGIKVDPAKIELEDKEPYAINCISKNMTPAELKYTMAEKEFLAVVHAINKLQHYITGYQVFVHIDHSAIRFLMNNPIIDGRIIRWLLQLQEFDITILDKLGKDNVVADSF